MPMAEMRAGSIPSLANRRRQPCLTQSHQTAGSCSAQPARGLWIASSDSGWVTDPRLLPLCPSSTDNLTEELPTSIPKNSMLILLSRRFKELVLQLTTDPGNRSVRRISQGRQSDIFPLPPYHKDGADHILLSYCPHE